jgi:tetrahydromethanopterin S-methyltransferase subunit G
MSNEEMVEDLKQFISAEIRMGLRGVETRLDGVETRLDGVETRLDRLETRLDRLETKIDNGLSDVNARLDAVLEAAGDDIVDLQDGHKDHERRIVKLEPKTA